MGFLFPPHILEKADQIRRQRRQAPNSRAKGLFPSLGSTESAPTTESDRKGKTNSTTASPSNPPNHSENKHQHGGGHNNTGDHDHEHGDECKDNPSCVYIWGDWIGRRRDRSTNPGSYKDTDCLFLLPGATNVKIQGESTPR